MIAAANPLRGLAADAAAVSDVVRSIDGPVVLVAHSYGGAVISNVDADAGEIVGLVYVNGVRPGARRELLRARGACSRAACSARRRCGRSPRSDGTTDLYIAPRQLPRHVLRGRPRAAGRADGGDAAPGHPGGARRAVGRASAVEGACRRGS